MHCCYKSATEIKDHSELNSEACGQQGYTGSSNKILQILHFLTGGGGCCLMEVVLYNGHKTVLVVAVRSLA